MQSDQYSRQKDIYESGEYDEYLQRPVIRPDYKIFSDRFIRGNISSIDVGAISSDLLPIANSTYNIGMEGMRFLNGYFSGNMDVNGNLDVAGNAIFQDNVEVLEDVDIDGTLNVVGDIKQNGVTQNLSHTNRTQLDVINQNLSTTSNVSFGDINCNEINVIDFFGGGVSATEFFILPIYTDATRPTPSITAALVIYNSDDGNLNIANGTNWILPDGTVT